MSYYQHSVSLSIRWFDDGWLDRFNGTPKQGMWIPYTMPTPIPDPPIPPTALELAVDALIASVATKASQASVDAKADQSDLNSKAPIDSPTLTGLPKVPTAATADSSQQAASTEHVKAAIMANPSAAEVTRGFVTTTTALGFQIDPNRYALVSYSLTIVTTASIGGASSGVVYLEICPTNSAVAANWIEIARVGNGQAISLAVVLQSVNTQPLVLSGFIPPGYYVRLRRDNTATSYTYNVGQELKL